MWLAKSYKYINNSWKLFNRIPYLVSDRDNIWRSSHLQTKKWWREYTSGHGSIDLAPKFAPLFENVTYPIEVDLVRCDESEAMFHVQRFNDKNGFGHLYIDYRPITVYYGNTATTICNIQRCNRLPAKLFPELKHGDNYIPVKIKIRDKQ